MMGGVISKWEHGIFNARFSFIFVIELRLKLAKLARLEQMMRKSQQSAANSTSVIPPAYYPVAGSDRDVQKLEEMIREGHLLLTFLNKNICDPDRFYDIVMDLWENKEFFVNTFIRNGGDNGGAHTTGKGLKRIEPLLFETEPFKSILNPLVGENGFFDAVGGFALANECGEQDMHGDGSYGDATHRLVISSNCVGKTMVIRHGR